MEAPHAMSLFSTRGVGPEKIKKRLGDSAASPGCYVLIDSDDPIYVGISKNVIRRLRQHVRGTTHFDASLAYKIAATRKPHTMTRKEAMSKHRFHLEFEKARSELSDLHVAFIPIANLLELHLFEAYCAMELDTSKWNTFETH
jgi:predicted GIY-YIG superfamily endonuclease